MGGIMRSSTKLFVTTTALTAAFLITPAANAQDTAPESADSAPAADEPANEIIITGTRLQNSNFSAPTPVTAIGEQDINLRAPSNVSDILQAVPSFRPTNSPTTSGVNSRGGGTVTADLRGLGPERTLVLVNGRRFVPSGTNGVVDLKLIPSLLIGRVDTVTGGASAAWGSDAVAGVVNFVLKDDLEGINASIQTGISEEGDGEEYRGSFAAGTSLVDGRLKLMLGGDFVKNEGIGTQYTRDWGKKEVGLISNTDYATNGLPQYIITPGVHPSLMSPGGLVVSGPLRGTAFAPDGTAYQFQYGDIYGSNMVGGDNVGSNLSNASQLSAPYVAKILMGTASFEVSPALTLFAEANAAWANSSGNSQQPRDNGSLTIAADNAYLPQSVKDAMAANGLTSLQVGRLNNDAGGVGLKSTNETLRGVIGARGDISADWSWEAYYEYGQNKYSIVTGPNNRIVGNFMKAIDAVVDTDTGAIVCRSTLTDPTNGCRPQNIFGDGNVVVDDYSFGSASFYLTTKQQVASASLSGSPFQTWAGDVSIAAGAEYRKESADGTSDELSQQVQPNGRIGAFQIGNQLPIKGSYDLWEMFGEIGVPLLSDSPLGRSLDLNAAIRRTDYSTSGAVTTWKVGFTYSPIDDIMFRATRSRDIRAPNLAELFQAGASSYVNVYDAVLGRTVQVRELNQGNLDLTPEKADTWTAGVVLTPNFMPGLSLSVDYYNIKVDDAIGTISSPVAVDRCNAGQTIFCSQIVYDADGTIAYTTVQNLNLNAQETAGVDLEARYSFPIGSLPGRFGIRAAGTYVDKLVTIDASGRNDYVGKVSNFQRVSGVPHFLGNVDFTYSSDGFSAGLLSRIVGAGKYDPSLTEGAGMAGTINKNNVPAYVYLSLSLSQSFDVGGHDVEIFGFVNNLLDTDPPFIPSGTIGGANETSTNPVFYDVVGRAYKIGARFKF